MVKSSDDFKGEKEMLRKVTKELKSFLNIINDILKLNNNLTKEQKDDYCKLKTLLKKSINDTHKTNSSQLYKEIDSIESVIKLIRKRQVRQYMSYEN